MASPSTLSSSPLRVLTVGVELQMAFFDGATNESVVDVLRTAGLKADKGPCAKTDTAEQLWRVKEDEFVFTKAQLTRDGGDHTPWTEFKVAFNLPPNARDFAPPSSMASKLQPRLWGGKGAEANPDKKPPIIDGPAFCASIRSPTFEDDQGPKTEVWQSRLHAVMKGIKDSAHRTEVNSTTGFHVRIGAGGSPESTFTLEEVKKIAALYLAYEKRIDRLHPEHRHDSTHARSNLTNSEFGHSAQAKKSQPFDDVFASATMAKLVQGMCTPEEHLDGPEDTEKPFYKLNLVGLLGEEQAVEWRQHGATTDPTQVCRWANFTLAFVRKALAISEEELRKLRTDDNASIFDDPALRRAYYGLPAVRTGCIMA